MWMLDFMQVAAERHREMVVTVQMPDGPHDMPFAKLPVAIGLMALAQTLPTLSELFAPGGMDRPTYEALDGVYRQGRRRKRRAMRKLREVPWTAFEKDRGAGAPQDEDAADWKELWANSRYHVLVYEQGSGVTWLSIRRNDREPIWEWREMQRIKNEILGPEREAVQIFPAESRLVDTSNQFHLWVLAEGERIPFGMGDQRLVSEGSLEGSVQEPFDPDCRPDDVITTGDIDPELIERFKRTGPAGFEG